MCLQINILRTVPIAIFRYLIILSQNRCARADTTGWQLPLWKQHPDVWLCHDHYINNSAAFVHRLELHAFDCLRLLRVNTMIYPEGNCKEYPIRDNHHSMKIFSVLGVLDNDHGNHNNFKYIILKLWAISHPWKLYLLETRSLQLF